MRNPTALAFQPQTGDLYAAVQERDGLGDRLPSDYLTRVQQGGFYGWPYAYIGKHPQAGFVNLAPGKVEATIVPDLLFEAHSSVLDFVFYDGAQFPAEYRGSVFVALKGSWNRAEPTGYKVVRVPSKDGRPEGYYENFVTGFWVSGERRAEVWGRPAALAVTRDGASTTPSKKTSATKASRRDARDVPARDVTACYVIVRYVFVQRGWIAQGRRQCAQTSVC